MKTLHCFRIKSAAALLIFLFAMGTYSPAQTPQYYNFNTTTPTNSFPFNIAAGKQIQLLYLPGDFNQPSPAPAGNIVSVSFIMAAALGPYNYTNLVIKMGQTNITAFSAGVWYTGQLDTVYSRATVSLTGTAGQWLTIPLDRPFAYDPTQSLVIDVQQCGAAGAAGFSSATTTQSGFRRNTSLTTSACPFVWGQQSGTLNNVGFTLGSTNCAYSWTTQTSGTAQALRSVKAVNDMVVWAAGNAGTVRKTTDGGASWTDGNPNPGVINGLIYNIDAIDANTAWCTTSPAATYIYKTTNGGTNWVQVFEQTGGFINAIEFINSTTGFAQGDPVSARWSLWKTTDAGSTWDSAGLYLPQVGTEAGWVNSLLTRGNNIWFGTNNTKSYNSTNFGSAWTSGVTTGLLNSYSIHFNSNSLGLAGGTAIVKSTDGGATYTSVGTAPGTGNINAIEGKDNDFWYIRGTGIYRSTNAGDNWTQVHTITGTGNDMDFPAGTGCLVGWAVNSTGVISKMTGLPVGITGNYNEIPETFKLEQNYPNPFNPVTNIKFALSKSGYVEIKVFDVLGKETAVLVQDFKQAGTYTVDFNAANLTSGVYFYKMVTGDFTEIKKMMLIK
ncbi:MAG: T9SS type A sorting domain-containing protein [Ignavibacteria bacterium]|nr:T9SS type A sorting domain-containing protein [Ignavibacteria bacterium]